MTINNEIDRRTPPVEYEAAPVVGPKATRGRELDWREARTRAITTTVILIACVIIGAVVGLALFGPRAAAAKEYDEPGENRTWVSSYLDEETGELRNIYVDDEAFYDHDIDIVDDHEQTHDGSSAGANAVTVEELVATGGVDLDEEPPGFDENGDGAVVAFG